MAQTLLGIGHDPGNGGTPVTTPDRDPYREALKFEVTDEEVTLRADRREIRESDLHFAMQGDLLTVWGDTPERRGLRHGFCRSVRLPGPVAAHRAEVIQTPGEVVVRIPRPGASHLRPGSHRF